MKLSRFRNLLALNLVAGVIGGVSLNTAAQNPQVATNIGDPSKANVYTPSNLNRVGVQTAQPVPLTLIEAIRRSLENNNDIEITRDDVRFQETQVRSLKGVYDPVFSITPTFSRSSSTGSAATRDFRVNAGLDKFFERGGGSIQSFFNNQRTENAFAQAQVSSGSV